MFLCQIYACVLHDLMVIIELVMYLKFHVCITFLSRTDYLLTHNCIDKMWQNAQYL